MMFDEKAELRLADERIEAARREIRAHRLARSLNAAATPAGRGFGAILDGALVRVSQGAIRRQEARRSRAGHNPYRNPDPAA